MSGGHGEEIIVIPFPHAGHIFPATELCIHLAHRNHPTTILLPAASSKTTPSSSHPLIRVLSFTQNHSTRLQPQLLEDTLRHLLLDLFNASPRPLCVVIDDMLSWLIEPCLHHNIPAVSFFTSGACAAALHHAEWKLSPAEFTSRSVIPVPGLPEDMALTLLDLHRRSIGAMVGHRRARGVEGSAGAVALIVNTCDDLERPFLDYLACQTGKKAFGLGPLLPNRFWTGVQVLDSEVRSTGELNVSVEELTKWLDSKPRGSVVYVSFGSLVSPSDEEMVELGAGLQGSNRPFIWVIQSESKKYDPIGQPIHNEESVYCFDSYFDKVNKNGLVIRGWAPQLTILGHEAVGGFVTHCGWNSTLEALVLGVPMLTWPIRGDQTHNAKLVTNLLGAGCALKAGDRAVTKEDVLVGLEKLMGDEGMRNRAAGLKDFFADGFPKSSSTAIDDLLTLVKQKNES